MVVDGYVLETLLGQGSRGVCFLARRPGDPERVVCKAALRDFPSFIEDAWSWRRLVHPDLVLGKQLVLPGRRPGPVVLLLEYLPGGNLSQQLRKHPHGLPERQALDAARAVCRALHCLHRQGLVHGSLSPTNLLFDGEGRCRLAGLPRWTRQDALPEQAHPAEAGSGAAALAHSLIEPQPDVAEHQPPPPRPAGVSALAARPDMVALGQLLQAMLTGTHTGPVRLLRPDCDAHWQAIIDALLDPASGITAQQVLARLVPLRLRLERTGH